MSVRFENFDISVDGLDRPVDVIYARNDKTITITLYGGSTVNDRCIRYVNLGKEAEKDICESGCVFETYVPVDHNGKVKLRLVGINYKLKFFLNGLEVGDTFDAISITFNSY